MATLFSSEKVAQARALREAGRTHLEIARELGTCKSTIEKWLSGKLRAGKGKRIVFTPEQVVEIRRLRAIEGLSQDELALRYKTTQGVIGMITRGSSYRDVGGYKLAPKARDGSRKLRDDDVRRIRELRAAGHSPTKLARRYNVSKSLIFGICGGYLRASVL
jgi:transcriptional regulator with XRE-family HTH domain